MNDPGRNYSLVQLKAIADSWKQAWREAIYELSKHRQHIRQAKQRWHEASMQYKIELQKDRLSPRATKTNVSKRKPKK